ncbi:MAG TPA: M23 family metallopeptidase [Candidatus Dormibacteraeota bacterium]|nr:M23 family metallopeptidase [Candidatus Dormibacteraeota bacterium]
MDLRNLALSFSVASLLVIPTVPDQEVAAPAAPVRAAPARSADVFQYPLPTWSPHCLGFGSEWRYCNGTALRSCASGAVWLHTGTDEVAAVGQPVMAAGDGVIIGYQVDPTFRGGVLIRHQMTAGVVITQYWHVWLRSGYGVGSSVKRGDVFADVADMGSRTHLHFAVFNGDMESHAWNGALPPSQCSGFPAFPYRFVDPTAFIESHQPVARLARGIRF